MVYFSFFVNIKVTKPGGARFQLALDSKICRIALNHAFWTFWRSIFVSNLYKRNECYFNALPSLSHLGYNKELGNIFTNWYFKSQQQETHMPEKWFVEHSLFIWKCQRSLETEIYLFIFKCYAVMLTLSRQEL